MAKPSLLLELHAILSDYATRIDRLGPETLRLRDESFSEWDRRQRWIRLCLGLLERAVAAECATCEGK